jgi:hypothetical protein
MSDSQSDTLHYDSCFMTNAVIHPPQGCGSVLATENLQLVPVIAAALRKKRSEACPGVTNHVTALPERHCGAAVTDSSCNSGRTSYGALRGATTKAGATLESPSPGRVSPSVIDDADHEAAMKLLGLEVSASSSFNSSIYQWPSHTYLLGLRERMIILIWPQ